MIEEKTIQVFVNLLDEGTPTYKGTQAIDLGDGKFKLLQPLNYDPEDEVWEFLPDSVVRCIKKINYGEELLLAVEQVNKI